MREQGEGRQFKKSRVHCHKQLELTSAIREQYERQGVLSRRGSPAEGGCWGFYPLTARLFLVETFSQEHWLSSLFDLPWMHTEYVPASGRKTEKPSGREPQVSAISSLQPMEESAEEIWVGHRAPVRHGQSLTLSGRRAVYIINFSCMVSNVCAK